MTHSAYSIVTAARNEGRYIFKTLQSVVSQVHRPVEWIIIDDGSTDDTSAIIDSYCKNHTWITKIRLDNFLPGLKTTGGRVGHLLNIAVKKLRVQSDFITKLDADTQFQPDFFQRLLYEFEHDKKLGIASGNLVFEGRIMKMAPDETKGAVMIIRREIFEQVGGFFESRGRGEDTLFSVAARFFGWKTKTFPVYFDHLKPEGVRHSSFRQAYTTGSYKGSIPYRFDFFLLTQLKHIFKRPFLIGSLVQLAGYVNSRFIERYRPFPDFVRQQLNAEQKRRMFGSNKNTGGK